MRRNTIGAGTRRVLALGIASLAGTGGSAEAPRAVAARLDPALRAVLVGVAPLGYSTPPAAELDLPSHPRAASAARRWGSGLLVVQDDVQALVLHSEAGSLPLLLPPGPGGRRRFDDRVGNREAKMDLEAAVVLPDGRFLAVGSGAAPPRERLVLVAPSRQVRIVDATALYDRLRAVRGFAGSELNVEGALVADGALRLFQRGNGAPRGNLRPVDATADLPLEAFLRWLDGSGPAPEPVRIRRYDLGSFGDVRLGFTDAAVLADGRICFVACAERSPDALSDGEVVGCRFGVIDSARECADVRTADVVDVDGRPLRLKIEGIEVRDDDDAAFDVVVDADRPDAPALLGRLRVDGL